MKGDANTTETDSLLDAVEAAELAALEKQVDRGKIAAGSRHWERYLSLLRRKNGTAGETVAVPSIRFSTDEAAATYYGMTWSGYMKLKALAKQMGDPLPVDEPEKMPQWFDRARAAGLRKHRTPAPIIDRANEALSNRGAEKLSAKSTAPARAPELVLEPLEVTETAASNADIEANYRRISAALAARLEREIRLNQTVEARATKSELDATNEMIRQWAQARKKIIEGEGYLPRDQVESGAAAFCKALWRNLTAALIHVFPAAEEQRVRRALGEVEERLPSILPEFFTTEDAEAA